MADLHITCVVSDGSDRDFRIDAVGGGNGPHSRWLHKIDKAILNIECRTHRYFTKSCGKIAWVIVKVHPATGRKYLTTEADGYSSNNLSNLQSCPVAA